jgi:alpha-methylacyl-CoA racemase
MLLSELGADVVRVDRPAAPGRKPPTLTRGRRSVVADLKDPEGRDAVLRLAERADVLIEGYRPGVAERLGLGPDDVLGVNPALVYARMTGWGQDGPWAHAAGHDINYVAVTGVLAAIGQEGGPPQIPSTSWVTSVAAAFTWWSGCSPQSLSPGLPGSGK